MATWNLNIDVNNEGGVECKFSKDTHSMHSHIVDIYVTGDLAIQAMALEKESMSGWWCMLCKASRREFLEDQSKMWTMDEQRPWWSFIPLTNYVSPLLHCEIGIGNDLFGMLCDITNEHIETYSPGEEAI